MRVRLMAFDLLPRRDLYARFRVCEYWVLDLIQDRILVHCQPIDGTFQRTKEYRRDDKVSLEAFPDFWLAVENVFGRRRGGLA